MQLTADGVDLAASLAIHAVIHPLQVPLWIDLSSVVVAALAGAAVAVEERFDLGGIRICQVPDALSRPVAGILVVVLFRGRGQVLVPAQATTLVRSRSDWPIQRLDQPAKY